MAQLEEVQKFEQVARKVEPESKFLRAWELKGGISAQVTALELEQPDGKTKKMVIRQHGEVDFKQNPQIAADEFRLLQILQPGRVAAPKPYYLDQSGEIFTRPYLVMEYIEGTPEFAPANLDYLLFQLAGQLSTIHKIACSQVDLSFLPDQIEIYTEKLRKRPERLDESLSEGHIREVLGAVWPLPQKNSLVLLHGDFWPGNILWRDDRIVGVIDWEDAKTGDPLADLGNTRLEILWAFGVAAMENFTRHYVSMLPIDFTALPYWDLCAALRPASRIGEWAGDELIEKKMREGHRQFISQAFEKISNIK